MAEERIQKIMSEQGLCSRRAAEQIIAEGRVKVNGHPVKLFHFFSIFSLFGRFFFDFFILQARLHIFCFLSIYLISL